MCLMVPPPGMMKKIHLLLLSLVSSTLLPLMTAGNFVACFHLVKLLVPTCEMAFILFVVNFKFFALANFAGLLECQKALLDSPTHSGSLKVILMSFKMRWLNCILLCYTLESSICSILIKMRESWRWLPYLVLLFWKHFFRIPAYVQLKLSWMNTCYFLQKLYFWLYSIYVREKWENSDEEKKSLLSSVVLRWSKVPLFMQWFMPAFKLKVISQ